MVFLHKKITSLSSVKYLFGPFLHELVQKLKLPISHQRLSDSASQLAIEITTGYFLHKHLQHLAAHPLVRVIHKPLLEHTERLAGHCDAVNEQQAYLRQRLVLEKVQEGVYDQAVLVAGVLQELR